MHRRSSCDRHRDFVCLPRSTYMHVTAVRCVITGSVHTQNRQKANNTNEKAEELKNVHRTEHNMCIREVERIEGNRKKIPITHTHKHTGTEKESERVSK